MQHAPWQRSAVRATLLADRVATAKPPTLLAGKVAPAAAGLRQQLVGTLRRLRRRARSPLSATASVRAVLSATAVPRVHRAATLWPQHVLSVRRALGATAPTRRRHMAAAAAAAAEAVAAVVTWAKPTHSAASTAQGARHVAMVARHVAGQ